MFRTHMTALLLALCLLAGLAPAAMAAEPEPEPEPAAEVAAAETLALPDAVKYVPYAAEIPEGFLPDPETMPNWLSGREGALSGMPRRAGTYTFFLLEVLPEPEEAEPTAETTPAEEVEPAEEAEPEETTPAEETEVTEEAEPEETTPAEETEATEEAELAEEAEPPAPRTIIATLTVLENGDNLVRAAGAADCRFARGVADQNQYLTQQLRIERTAPAGPEAESLLSRFIALYLDGTRLRGGKVYEDELPLPDWQYYAEDRGGALRITVYGETFEAAGSGTHTLSVSLLRPDSAVLTEALSQNYTAFVFDEAAEPDYRFHDALLTRYRGAVKALAEAGVVVGFEDETFRPHAVLTRGQASAMMARLLGAWDGGGTAVFADTAYHWAAKYIAYCADRQIVSGYGGGSFGPDDSLTGYAWAKMLLCAKGYDAAEHGMTGPDWKQGVRGMILSYALDRNMSNWEPDLVITREEACQLTVNVFYLGYLPQAE